MIICLELELEMKLKQNSISQRYLGWTLVVSIGECQPSVLADIVHIQGCTKDSHLCVFGVCFWEIKLKRLYKGKTNKLKHV